MIINPSIKKDILRKVVVCHLLILTCLSCAQNIDKEKYQGPRNNIMDVSNQLKEIRFDDIMIGEYAGLYLIDNYLVISDHKSYDELIHLFDKTNFTYLTSLAPRGQGPGEIANMGVVGIDEQKRKLYVSDHGKQIIFSYDLDSVLLNPHYMPEEKIRMKEAQFPSDYYYLHDTLCIARIIEPIGNYDYKPSVGKWNMMTGEIHLMKYEHPKINKKRIVFAASPEHEIYVECYTRHDLMSICNFDGELLYNIYGNKWKKEVERRIHHYDSVIFCKDKILATYLGGDGFRESEKEGIKSNNPTKIHVFELNGDYLKTLDTNVPISGFCYDEDNHRIIMNIEDETQFAYLELKGLV